MTERAAVSAARLRGRGNEKAADQAAVDAMRRELNKLPIDGTVVIGEGERRRGADAVHRREGRHQERARRSTSRSIRSKAPRSAPRTCRARSRPWRWRKAARCCNAPDVYMEKIAIGPGYPKGTGRSRRSPAENIMRLAKAKGVKPAEITALLLDRPRHADMIAAVRKTGAAVSADHRRRRRRRDPLPPSRTPPASTSISASAARRKACWRRRRCAASAVRCRCRLVLDTEEMRERAAKMGIKDPRKKYEHRGHGEGRLPVRRHRRDRRRSCCAASSSART